MRSTPDGELCLIEEDACGLVTGDRELDVADVRAAVEEAGYELTAPRES
jgi:hypothetical protein